MSNVRLRLANGEPLLIPAHAYRFMESAGAEMRESQPDAEGVLLYDLGGQDGVQTVTIATSPLVVAEMVRTDPKFPARLLKFETAAGTTIWALGRHANGVVGHKAPTDDDLAAAEAKVAEAEQSVADFPKGELSADQAAAMARVVQLRANLENLKTFATVRSRLDLLIPDRKTKAAPDAEPGVPAGLHFTYWLHESADEVLEALEPTVAPPKPSVNATPVREPRKRKPRA